jgi:[calcium/calmodulin-dependent protein kinase] kinase
MLTYKKEHPWVTNNGIDPLLSAEENTAELVEPPTEEEMKHAITGSLSNLIVVVRYTLFCSTMESTWTRG